MLTRMTSLLKAERETKKPYVIAHETKIKMHEALLKINVFFILECILNMQSAMNSTSKIVSFTNWFVYREISLDYVSTY